MEIIGNSLTEVCRTSVKKILDEGTIVQRLVGPWNMNEHKIMPMRELRNIQLVVKNPYRRWYSGVKKGTIIEMLDMLLGDNPGFVVDEWKFYRDWLSSNGRLPYTYGERLRGEVGEIDQLNYIINMLNKDRTTRQAVALIRRPIDLTNKYQPCSISTFFQLNNDNKLDMTWVMRSNDAMLGGLWRNMFMNLHLFEQIAEATKLEMGSYYHYDFNLHIYEKDLDKAVELLSITEPDGVPSKSDLLTEMDKYLIRQSLKYYYHSLPESHYIQVYQRIFDMANSYFRSLLFYITKYGSMENLFPELLWLKEQNGK